MTIGRIIVLVALISIAVSMPASAQSAAAAGGAALRIPAVGEMAPDFTLPWADSAGTRVAPVKLSDLRGQVVVIAFYPSDRTQGCTAEMTKFRDEYATLFGAGVVVLPVSGDGLESHASWAKDMKFPFALVSDVGLGVADKYGSRAPGSSRASRNTFVVGKDGRITATHIGFRALVEAAYTALSEDVTKAKLQN